jgi:DNA gyrase subunit A
LMITTKRGIMIRMAAADLRVMGRATQGVRLINLKSGELIASVAKVPASEVEEGVEGTEGAVSAAEGGDGAAE